MSEPTLADKQLFLDMAIAEAVCGVRAGQGGPFGAVVVKDGIVIAKAANAVVANHDPTAHAEVQAIRAACVVLGSFQLAILWARPRALYFAATRQHAAAAGFDDAAFYETLAGESGASPIVREQVPCDDAGAPFAVYASLPGRVRY